MTWIKTIPPPQADAELLRIYRALQAVSPAEYQNDTPPVPGTDRPPDSIVAAHSLLPDAMWHIFAAFGVLVRPDLPLTRRQHEMIATVVSVRNSCVH